MLPAIAAHTPFVSERQKARTLDRAVREAFPLALRDRMMRTAVRFFARTWEMRLRLHGDGMQPATIRTRYPAGRRIVYSSGTGARLDVESACSSGTGRWTCREAAATALASGGSGTR